MIVGREIGLRPIEEADLPLLVQWRNGPQTRQMFYTPFLISEAGQHRWFEGLLGDPTRVQFMIVRLSDNTPIGTIGLHHINHRNQEAEAGPIMLDPELRGQELGIEAAHEIVRYGFEDMNLNRLYIELLDINQAGQRAAEKVGFVQEAIARQAVFVKGAFHNVIHMAILRDEWRARRGQER